MPLLSLVAALALRGGKTTSVCDLVDPILGATTDGGPAFAGLGRTFPGATTPFGGVQLSPDTITGGDNGPGYSYDHHSIEGFSFTHMSGIGWYGDMGNLLVMPTTGPLATNSGREVESIDGYRSPFRHETETAKPGYYGVTLDKYNVRAEATATPRAGILRFTFPSSSASRVQIDLARRIAGTSTDQAIEVVDSRTIRGWMHCTPDGGGLGDGQGSADYTVYFVGKFSKPLRSYGIWSATPPPGQRLAKEWAGSVAFQDWARAATRRPMARWARGAHLGFYSEFATAKDEPVLFKAGISYVSMDGARANLNAEIPDWDFDGVRKRANALWENALGRMTVEGGNADDRTIFTTALYHALLDPRAVTDVTGAHPSADGGARIDRSFTYRSIFSGWDVFRSEFPLLTLVAPGVVSDEVNTLVQQADVSGRGYLNRWDLLNAYTTAMIGNPAIPVIVDAYQKGIRDFPVDAAYRQAVASSEALGNGERGYVPYDLSSTLECGYDEWCVGQLAGWLGNASDAAKYAARAQSYRNAFDPSVGWFRARNIAGFWEPWPAEGETGWAFWCTESNPLQQGWFVPHDPGGLASLVGGPDAAAAKLEAFFEATPKDMSWNAYYNHANEPVHNVPFLFNVWGKPWLTQRWAHEIESLAYHTGPKGLCGNDDEGQTSAWYVLAAAGIHPLCPGNGRYEICGPRFDKVTLKLDSRYATGRTFTISAKRKSAGDFYIQSATLNGKSFTRSWIGHDEIARGGTLSFVMGPNPNPAWGVR